MINLDKIRKQVVPWKLDKYEELGKWKDLEHPHQATIPKDSLLLQKLHIEQGDEVLAIAGFWADWALALQKQGAIVDYSDISSDLVAHFKNSFRRAFVANYIDIPDKTKYDWTFSFEPCGGSCGLIIALLRSLLNRKGAVIVIFPRQKQGKPIGSKEMRFPKLFSAVADTYGCMWKMKDVGIEATRGSGKDVQSPHRVFWLYTNQKSRKTAEDDLKRLENPNDRISNLAKLVEPEFRRPD